MLLITAKRATLAATAIAIVLLLSQVMQAYEVEDCIFCHKLEGSESHLRISVEDLSHSVHGEEFPCLDCHAGIEDEEHMEITGSGRVDCGQCHEQENGHGLSGNTENRPQCFHCHTKHYILSKDNSASSVHPDNLIRTCRTCHPVSCGHTSAFSWLPSLKVASHGKRDFSQSYSKGNCVGCHQGNAAHGEEDPLNDQLCYLCHVPLGSQPLLAGYVHVKATAKDQPVSFAAGVIYAVVLALLLWGGFRYYITRPSRSADSEKV
jgi:hypothetical protein